MKWNLIRNTPIFRIVDFPRQCASCLQAFIVCLALEIKLSAMGTNFDPLECLGTIPVDDDQARNPRTLVSKHQRAGAVIRGKWISCVVRYRSFYRIVVLRRQVPQVISARCKITPCHDLAYNSKHPRMTESARPFTHVHDMSTGTLAAFFHVPEDFPCTPPLIAANSFKIPCAGDF